LHLSSGKGQRALRLYCYAHVTNDTAQLRFFFVERAYEALAGDLLIEMRWRFAKRSDIATSFFGLAVILHQRAICIKAWVSATQTHPNDEWGAPGRRSDGNLIYNG
jgi:hypothetical protein